MLSPQTSRGEALATLRRVLGQAGIEAGAAESRLLLASALGLTGVELLARPEEPLGASGAAELSGYLARRLAREPVGRILGRREFWGMLFHLSAETLEPRPDTEAVVEAALAACPDRTGQVRILDLGTGSGCILVALLAERPQARGVGLDRSLGALRTASGNARRNGVAERALFVNGDWAAAVSGPFDLVVANPPYIPGPDIAGLEPEVAGHDPVAALDGGPDGLAAYRAILPDLPRLLAPDGAAVLEVGYDQAAAVAALATHSGLRVDRTVPDLGGRNRAVLLRPPV
ncbi:peptide chain release factor N(5)-glutamine methyltransferase [Enterovirga sp.]|jgi:release factor glutamine methyltransferase|uniref:peptide chain release factor N(5)-glutamine methyltransferase n=1 Tax=Enterovirga sp. TaxID=2026350 RepID=UPI0026305B9F|nr:peptide chain release factor N(5)-glutamine methyltransferase [Enterovirga sp.]MDB5590561.1 prmC [Enterovirga sp.]